jgi:hypothetical protein
VRWPLLTRPSQRRDEPGPGGVRVGATRTDLDCRVVATSRRVAPTECDSRLPLFGRGSTCRLRLSSTPGRHARRQWYSTRRAARLVCRDQGRPDRVRLVRHTSHVGCGPTRPTRPTLSEGRTLSDEDVTAHATRQTCPRSKYAQKSARLVDSSDSSDSVGRRCHGTRDSSDMPPLESPPDSSTRQTPRTLSDEDVTAPPHRILAAQTKVNERSNCDRLGNRLMFLWYKKTVNKELLSLKRMPRRAGSLRLRLYGFRSRAICDAVCVCLRTKAV